MTFFGEIYNIKVVPLVEENNFVVGHFFIWNLVEELSGCEVEVIHLNQVTKLGTFLVIRDTFHRARGVPTSKPILGQSRNPTNANLVCIYSLPCTICNGTRIESIEWILNQL